jgi:hypothetical protein
LRRIGEYGKISFAPLERRHLFDLKEEIMKKIIGIVIAVVVILIVLKMIGIDVSLSPEPSHTVEEEGKKVYYPYELSQEGNKSKDIIGMPLPKTATDVHGPVFYIFNPNSNEPTTYKLSWLVAKIPKEDFYALVEKLGLIRKPDLLEVWPEALECEYDKFNRFWDLQKTVTEDTYFIEDPDEETYRLFKYENGNLYVKKSTTYIAFKSKENEILYKKAEKEVKN